MIMQKPKFHILKFQPHPRPELIDKKVIDGHIIPNRVVFTKSAPIEQPFETLAFEDNIKVTVTFFTQGEGKNMKSMYKCAMRNVCILCINPSSQARYTIR